MADDPIDVNAVELATELTIAWLGNPNTRTSSEEVPAFLNKMHETVSSLLGAAPQSADVEAPTEYVPAVSVRKSLASKDHIVSMIDGKPYKTLRRHLATHGLTPEEYRDRYGLKSDYPMVAESYSESRRAMAKKIGLGRKPGPRNAAATRKPRKGEATADAE
ncbi:MucR family transcriptional regulator [Sphingomonas sp. CFBP8993]|uniref:MucR family transcriptional regulator n=1 Tax=Sphingomonas sp. CFBP8993 TaxID=3096526 RepID=UPI002A69FF39|nr:MucR family transcriptional regulator [Sphingomonas sp. CFBP8993]MDY0959451.1 MucR family transcriptional regulator [Sphingomonas sp. CFBP8993]